MSHFTEIKTRLVEKKHLISALRDLGCAVEEFARIRGYNGITETVEIKIPSGHPDYDIGFRRNGESFDMVADWGELKKFKRQEFLQQLTQRYALHAAREQLQEQGFTIASEEQNDEGRIHLVLRRMA